MKKRFFAVICVLLCLLMLPMGSFFVSADGTHGFYMDCDASVTNGKSDGFMIDFYSDSPDALCTYFSNANWSMYTEATEKRFGYKNMVGGGAYAGLQILDRTEQRRGIMSFWRYDYTDGKTGEKKHLYAEAVYGSTTQYDNEGSGTSCVMPFQWESSRWYRQLLLCWRDAETGNTFMGTWFYDYEEDRWSLFAYYDTKLVGSYIKGGVGQFLENFSESQRQRYRSFRYRGIYFLPHAETEWVSSPTVSIRSDGNAKAHGEAKLGVSEDNTYVWASVDGRSEVDTDHILSLKPTLTQPERPASIGTPKIADITVQKQSNGVKIGWTADEHSTPQLSYTLRVYNTAGKQVGIQKGTRPEVNSILLDSLKNDALRVELSVTDVFGQSTVTEFESESYKQAMAGESVDQGQQKDPTLDDPSVDDPIDKPADKPADKPTDKPSGNNFATEDETDSSIQGEDSPKEDSQPKNNSTALIVALAIGGMAILSVLAVMVVKYRKKK